MKKITINGRFPGINQYIQECRKNQYCGAKMKKAAEQAIQKDFRAQKMELLIPPITICYTFFEPNKRRDKDNISGFFHKVFQDALTQSGYLENDSWDYIEGYHDYFDIDAKNPRIEIKIIEKGD